MDKEKLEVVVGNMLRVGILAADEGHGTADKPKTIEKRLKAAGIPQTEEYVDAWRRLVRDIPSLGLCVSAIILETSRLRFDAPIYAVNSIVPGVKVDKGTNGKVGPYDEQLTIGLDDLANRLHIYAGNGARFAKWRTLTEISRETPTQESVDANMDTEVSYADKCQKAGVVPVCEPEVHIVGDHGINRAYDVIYQVLSTLFRKMKSEDIYLPGAVLKTSMVTPGKDYDPKASVEEVADMTLKCLLDTVPPELGGVVFLSGGQTDLDAVKHLNEMNRRIYDGSLNVPWPITFSYSRAIQNEAMNIWKGKPENVVRAQEALLERAEACALASKGRLPNDFKYTILV